MPAGEAPFPQGSGNPCSVCWEIIDDNDAPLLEHDLGCRSAEQLHWFCSPCIAHLHACSLCRRPHHLCTAPPWRETQTNDLTLHTLRTLIVQNVWAPPDADGGDSPDVTWLDVLGEEDLGHHPAAPGRHQGGRYQTGRKTPRSGFQTTNITAACDGAAYPPLAICRTVGAPLAR